MFRSETVHRAFEATCDRYADRTFLATTAGAASGEPVVELTYAETRAQVDRWIARLRAAGYGGGHRVAVLCGNRPVHFVVNLALNALGISVVPLNPDLTTHELAYVIGHSESLLVICMARYRDQVDAARAFVALAPACVTLDDPGLNDAGLPPAKRPASAAQPGLSTECGLLYTSGTTGRPKGCILSNRYYLWLGATYAQRGGLATVRDGAERILNPLPLFHQNAGIFSFMCAVLSGNCVLMTDRFHASTWWREVRESRATIVHYLGVMPAILLKLPVAADERDNDVRFAIGAGVEPSLHATFEARFGFPLIELWGMTEAGCGFIAADEPRQVGSRAVGGPRSDVPTDFEIRLVDDLDADVPTGVIGELLVRRPGGDPAAGMFSGYLKDKAATATAWAGGWFHSGDAFVRDADGTLHFAERKKNIIRRAGENIAAAEVEAVLLDHPRVARAAVIAVVDDLREEEVLACIVPIDDGSSCSDADRADELFAWARERLAYYKPPGWIVFLDRLPVTSTQKVQKARLFEAGADPRVHPRAIDLRHRKRRDAVPTSAASP